MWFRSIILNNSKASFDSISIGMPVWNLTIKDVVPEGDGRTQFRDVADHSGNSKKFD